MTHEQSFEAWEEFDAVEHVVDASASDAVVLKTECHKLVLVCEHLREVKHHVIVEVVVVQEDFFERLVVCKGG